MTSKLLADRQAAPAEELVPVLMAKVKVPGWTPIKEPEKFFEVRMLPESAVSKSSLKSFDEVKDQRLNKPLEAERAALQGDLLTKEQQSLADSLAPGMRAIAVKVNAESIAGGFVLQGAGWTWSARRATRTRRPRSSSRACSSWRSIRRTTRNAEQQSILAQTVTLAATPEEATRLSLAESVGELRLLPKSHGDTKRMANVVTRLADLDKPLRSRTAPRSPSPRPAPVVTTPLPEIKEPVKPETAPAPAVVEKPRKKHVMTIINGTSREKAVFIEGEETRTATTASTPAKKEEKPKRRRKKAKAPRATHPRTAGIEVS